MAEKSLKVQFRQRRATASYWGEHDIVPGAGEIIVYLPDDSQSDISFKIGDGSGTLAALPMFVKVSGGPAGTTFKPAVSSDGILSWTNDGGLENPADVNIKGPKGDNGDTGATGADGTGIADVKIENSNLMLKYTNSDNYINLGKVVGDKGADGAAGTPGTNGKDGTNGYTFTPAVSSAGVISWTNNGGLTNPTSVNIKGPKGDKGNDGTGVSIKSSQSECIAIGDAYIGTNGHLYILSTLPSTFTDGGEIKGPQGDKGDPGETGATGDGIKSITKTSTSGLVDTYTITFTSGKTPTTFTVTNGQNGSDATVEWGTF